MTTRRSRSNRPTVHDVAQRAGVSIITVSRVISGTIPVSGKTRAKVGQAVRELGYVPNELAAGLKGRPTRTIGLIVGDISNPFFTALARGAEDIAISSGFSVILCNADDDPDKEAIYRDLLLRKRVDGLILCPAGEHPEPIVEWRRQGGPVCIVDRALRRLDHAAAGIDVVRGEDVVAAERLVAHLLSHGRRRVAILCGPPALSTAADRLAGYRRALAAAGCSAQAGMELFGRFSVESGRTLMARLLDGPERPDAVFAANNFLAVGALAVARQRGLSIPEDLALVTFDEIPLLTQAWPFLTVASQPAAALGRKAATCLIQRITGSGGDADAPGREIVLQPHIALRRSCGCPGRRAVDAAFSPLTSNTLGAPTPPADAGVSIAGAERGWDPAGTP